MSDYEDRHRTFRVKAILVRDGRVVLGLTDTGETGRSPTTYSLPADQMDRFLASNQLGPNGYYHDLLGRKVVANVREREGSAPTVTQLVGLASEVSL